MEFFPTQSSKNTALSRGVSTSLQIKRYRYPDCETRRLFQTIITLCIRDNSTKYYDFAVIGSGVAGLRYALKVAKHGNVTIITKPEPHESNTNYAQGGGSAVLCPSDYVESHMQNTIVARAYLCDDETVRETIYS
ncbi:FAD binding domain-containing protein [Artemisia annua]|uniref:FAD binding domain-containing protein n=1 Tax=Artemisia annua TaxID=35608 RepID=A0A2U1MSC5_ARTAN|nr:FAD binding domain-containing protein [Artemisia annua]